MVYRKTRQAYGWRLRVARKHLYGRQLWYVIVGVNEDGKEYMFSRHISEEYALRRLQGMDPRECQKTPL